MSRRFEIIVLVVVFALGFATATLWHRLGADDSGPQSKGLVAFVEKHVQSPDPNYSSTPQALSANIPSEDPVAPVSQMKSEEGVRAPNKAKNKERIRLIWGDLIDELGLDTERANELMKLYVTTKGADRAARLREELGEAGYQAYLDYLPTLPLRGEIVPFKAELAKRNIPLDRETEKSLLQIIREERPSGQQGKVTGNQSESQVRERIYKRASGIFSGEALSVFKAWGESKL